MFCFPFLCVLITSFSAYNIGSSSGGFFDNLTISRRLKNVHQNIFFLNLIFCQK